MTQLLPQGGRRSKAQVGERHRSSGMSQSGDVLARSSFMQKPSGPQPSCCGMSSRRGLSGRRAVETRTPRQGVRVLRLSAPFAGARESHREVTKQRVKIALRWKARGSGGLAWKRARLPLLSAYAQSEVSDLRTASVIGATRRAAWAPVAGRDVRGNAQSFAGKRVFGVARQVPRLLV